MTSLNTETRHQYPSNTLPALSQPRRVLLPALMLSSRYYDERASGVQEEPARGGGAEPQTHARLAH